ncbi:MAG: hypothetical protein J0M16_12590 [Gammaproteobacteria bacterium]|nr:hypothetical protein [Gammaproteobacteria bacterium]
MTRLQNPPMLIERRGDQPMPRASLWELRQRLSNHVLDDTPSSRPGGEAWAIYSLSDPRHLRAYRYVGQTREPARRLLQHVLSAHAWARAAAAASSEGNWWLAPDDCRPLQAWIQELYRAGRRLPCLVIHHWESSARDAREAERRMIDTCLDGGHELFNAEARRHAGTRRLPLP